MDIHAEYQMALTSKSRFPVVATGGAGTGKTYGAVSAAVDLLMGKKIDRIVYIRVPKEIGDSIGFLPGEVDEKMAPWIGPMKDALLTIEGVTISMVNDWIRKGKVEAIPVGFLGGRTFNNTFIIIDEAQDMTYDQLKAACTRVGKYSRLVVTGCLSQVHDESMKSDNGLLQLVNALSSVENHWATIDLDRGGKNMRSDECGEMNNLFDSWERIRYHEGF